MRLPQVERFLTAVAEKDLHIPFAMIGESGIGKSAVVKQVAKALGRQCVDLRLATQEPGDLIGMPRGEGDRTVWLKPSWFPKEGTKGILFLDELNRAPTEVRQAVFQLLTEWRLHEHILPEGWSIVIAMNPEGDAGYQVETLDMAMTNRMLCVKAELFADDWLAWAHGSDVHESVTGFIAAHKDLLHKMNQDNEPFPSPRTWEYVSHLMRNTRIEEAVFTEVIAGLVGSTAAASFSGWLKKNYIRPVSAEEILSDYPKVVEKVRKQNRTQNNVTATDLAAKLTARHKANDKLTKPQREHVRQFIFDLPEHDDVRVAFIRKVPSTMLSSQLIGENTASAEKLAVLFNRIYRDAGESSSQ